MRDPRVTRLAELLVNHSTRLRSGEHVLIEAFDAPDEPVIALIEAARAAGAHPHVAQRSTRVLAALYRDAAEDNFRTWADCDLHRMKNMQAYIGLRGSDNVSEMSGVDGEQMKRYARLYAKPVHFEQRVNHTRWCVLRWPTASMAQLAQMSTRAFEDFYFDVCTLDYKRLAEAAERLAARMRRAREVHIRGPSETDLRLKLDGIPVIPCAGESNIPDGECFTAPVRTSVEGVIRFNAPTIYNGVTFEDVRLVFRQGRVVEATAARHEDRLREILATDEGAAHVGEFAIGFNPRIREPMKDILFDEKIAGSIHLTPGNAYETADNGNRSEIHWDLVLIQRPEHGGGTIHFDGRLVRRDGLFVEPELEGLNPAAFE
jgi:aminopeptidase